jgi:hypothetical protein
MVPTESLKSRGDSPAIDELGGCSQTSIGGRTIACRHRDGGLSFLSVAQPKKRDKVLTLAAEHGRVPYLDPTSTARPQSKVAVVGTDRGVFGWVVVAGEPKLFSFDKSVDSTAIAGCTALMVKVEVTHVHVVAVWTGTRLTVFLDGGADGKTFLFDLPGKQSRLTVIDVGTATIVTVWLKQTAVAVQVHTVSADRTLESGPVLTWAHPADAWQDEVLVVGGRKGVVRVFLVWRRELVPKAPFTVTPVQLRIWRRHRISPTCIWAASTRRSGGGLSDRRLGPTGRRRPSWNVGAWICDGPCLTSKGDRERRSQCHQNHFSLNYLTILIVCKKTIHDVRSGSASFPL